MWAKLNSDKDTIEEIISNPKEMIIDDVRHPRALFSVWTDAERKAIGIVPVTTTGSHLDTNYYIEVNEAFAIAGNKNSVVRTIGVKAADKKLADEDAKDEDGEQLYEEDGTTKKINYGLKTNAKNKATTQANGLLQGFDWLIQRKVTAETAIPSAVVTYMASIRTDHGNICTAIDGASDMSAFIALHNDTYKEDGTVDVVARVNRWTDDKDVKQHRR
jgi:flagellar hook-associated protein FlgK